MVTESIPGVRSVAVGVWIGVGSRFERPAEAGISHFLEHMLFKGTPTHSPEEIAQAFDALGGEVNAATGKDYTVLYCRVLDELLDRAMPLLADMAQRPVMRDLEQEREVVLEEIAMYEDDPQDQIHDLASEAVFPDQALGRPVIGTAEVIGGVTEAVVRDYHRGHYTAPNMVVAAAGNVAHERVLELSERLLREVSPQRSEGVFEPAAPGRPALVVKEKATEQYHVCLGGPGLSRNDPRRHAQSVLDTVLGGSMSSRLFQEVREKRGLAYSVGSYAVGYADAGQVGVYLGTREDNLGVACEIIGAELRRIGEEPLPADELRRAKDHLKGRLVLGMESSSTRMNRIGRAVLTDTELLTIDEIVERVEAVTADDVIALAREHWHPDAMSVAAIGPKGDAIRSAVAALSPQLAAA
ncbi:M16 family metallopeptidase [Miltoncostaea marina]|uniref:M16 family metallopeptidase n=1 Tax=Miltoncostaea marina TaxID=2843215 RepID=UPI001C3D40FB|nr:pitrilysin family protein [Miltoncostaea marina]